jgi:hypothetical protein
MAKDWMTEAAKEMHVESALGVRPYLGRERYREIIAKHCPLKPDTAYMPVPRCETCKHWRPYPPNAMSRPAGDCASITIYSEQGTRPFGTALDFGCVRWEGK